MSGNSFFSRRRLPDIFMPPDHDNRHLALLGSLSNSQFSFANLCSSLVLFLSYLFKFKTHSGFSPFCKTHGAAAVL